MKRKTILTGKEAEKYNAFFKKVELKHALLFPKNNIEKIKNELTEMVEEIRNSKK